MKINFKKNNRFLRKYFKEAGCTCSHCRLYKPMVRYGLIDTNFKSLDFTHRIWYKLTHGLLLSVLAMLNKTSKKW